MALNLPNPGQSPWANQLNSALSTLDAQTVVSGSVIGGNLILTRNDGSTVNAGSVGAAAQDVPGIVAIFENGLI